MSVNYASRILRARSVEQATTHPGFDANAGTGNPPGMRRPQTKTPYAYFHHGTRHRGRPVHRIYAPTPRPDMTGTWYLWNTFLTTVHMIAFTKDFNFWWCWADADPTAYFALPTYTEWGRPWNKLIWHRTPTIVTSWLDAAGTNDYCKGALGPVPPNPPVDPPTFSHTQ